METKILRARARANLSGNWGLSIAVAVVASLLGAILIHKGDFFSGYIDMIYGTLSNSSYHFVLFILMGFFPDIYMLQLLRVNRGQVLCHRL